MSKYKRAPNKDETIYIITLGLSREKITNNQVYNKYLYNINISKKSTVISTKILENSWLGGNILDKIIKKCKDNSGSAIILVIFAMIIVTIAIFILTKQVSN